MTIADPERYQIVLDVTAEEYADLLRRANEANHSTVQSFLKAAGKPNPVVPSKKVIHTVADAPEEEKKK